MEQEQRPIRLRRNAQGTYYAQLYLGVSPLTGRKIRPYREFAGMNEEQARAAAETWRDTVLKTMDAGNVRTGEALTGYVDAMETQHRSWNTIKTYRLYNRRYSAPIAARPVAAVTPAMLDHLFKKLLTAGAKGGEPLSAATVKKYREYLKGAFRYFMALGLVGSNPVSDTMPIRSAKPETVALDAADVSTLMDALRADMGNDATDRRARARRCSALVMALALATGARVGEVCALRVRDLDAPRAMLTICGTVAERRGESPRRQGETKGKRARTVALDAETLRALLDHLSWQAGYLGRRGRDAPLVSVDGSFLAPSTISARFRQYRAALGLDARSTLHSLRHTHATMLLKAGVDMRTVQERLGHANVSTTLGTYAHVLAGRDAAAARAWLESVQKAGQTDIDTAERAAGVSAAN